MSALSIGLHIFTSYEAWLLIKASDLSNWRKQLFCLLPWRSGRRNGLKRWASTELCVFGTLGDDPWINAVGWDVLFSGVGLCIWSVINSDDCRAMIQCEFFSSFRFPWSYLYSLY